MSPAKRFSILSFYAMACAGSWSIAGVFWALGGNWSQPSARAVGVLYLLPVALAALIVQGPLLKESFIVPFALSFRPTRWFVAAFFLPVAATLLALWIADAFPGVEVAWRNADFVEFNRGRVVQGEFEAFRRSVEGQRTHPLLGFILRGLLAGGSINALLMLAEELGWRGFLETKLGGPGRSGFWRRSAIVGSLWGIWYAPLAFCGYLFPAASLRGSFCMVGWALAFSPWLHYLRSRAESLFAVCIARGTYLALLSVPTLMVRGRDEHTTSLVGLAGILAWLVLSLPLPWLVHRIRDRA